MGGAEGGREGGGVFGGAHVSRRRPGSGGSLCPRPVPFPPPPPSRPSPATPAAPRRPPPPGESRRSRGGGGRAIAVQSLVFLIVENVTGPGGAAAQVPPPPPPPPAPGHRPSTREAGGGAVSIHRAPQGEQPQPSLEGFTDNPPHPGVAGAGPRHKAPGLGRGGYHTTRREPPPLSTGWGGSALPPPRLSFTGGWRSHRLPRPPSPAAWSPRQGAVSGAWPLSSCSGRRWGKSPWGWWRGSW